MNSNSNSREEDRKKESTSITLTSLNQTLRNVLESLSDKEAGTSERLDKYVEDDIQSKSAPSTNSTVNKSRSTTSSVEDTSRESQKSTMGARARPMKFTKALSGPTVNLDKLRELAWSGIPPYLRPTVWRLLLGYAPPNSDRREGVLRRKRLEYLDCAAQYYEVPDTERTDEEITMLRQIAVDCPRTVPNVTFFQQAEVQKSLERILYTWFKEKILVRCSTLYKV